MERKIDVKITNMMCLEAARGVKLQYGREYGFDNTTTDLQDTILSEFDKAELKGLPTHNITGERKHLINVLAKFWKM